MDLLFEEGKINKKNNEFNNTGNSGCNCRAFNSHCRSAEMSENENPVERNVYDKGRKIDNNRNFYNMGGAKYGGHRVGYGIERICPTDYAKIACAGFDNFKVVRIPAHDRFRNAYCKGGSNKAYCRRKAEHYGNNPFHGINVIFAPILRSENHCGRSYSESDYHKNEEKLVCKVCARKGNFTNFSEHKRVRKAYGESNEVLRRNGHCY